MEVRSEISTFPQFSNVKGHRTPRTRHSVLLPCFPKGCGAQLQLARYQKDPFLLPLSPRIKAITFSTSARSCIHQANTNFSNPSPIFFFTRFRSAKRIEFKAQMSVIRTTNRNSSRTAESPSACRRVCLLAPRARTLGSHRLWLGENLKLPSAYESVWMAPRGARCRS